MSTHSLFLALVLSTALAPFASGAAPGPDSGHFEVDGYELAYVCAGAGSP
jgi:hypothetical protein